MFGTFGGNGPNPFGFGFGGRMNLPQRFDEEYRVYPVSFADKSHLEDGDKILLPPSALDTLARLHIDYPMLFKLEHSNSTRVTHCGVLEFSAPEGSCYLPYWMMQNLCITEGSIIRVQNATLPKATFVKIRPQSIDFLDISNPRAVLEASLRKFSCMTVGDTICLRYNDQNFFLDVREVRPEDAACIIETDCEVDFEAPPDYRPNETKATPPPAPTNTSTAQGKSVPFGGVSTVNTSNWGKNTSGGRALGTRGGLRMPNSNSSQGNTDLQTLRDARMKKYEAFHGTGRSMNGGTSALPNSQRTTPENSVNLSSLSLAQSKQSTQGKDTKGIAPFSGNGRRLR